MRTNNKMKYVEKSRDNHKNVIHPLKHASFVSASKRRNLAKSFLAQQHKFQC